MTAPAAITGDFVPAGPARGSRPATVTIGAAFQAVAVVSLLALIALAWITRAQYDGFADEAARLVSARPDELEAERTSNLIMAVVVSVLAGVPALWFGSTLWPLFRGANVARILAAVGAFAIPGFGILLVIGSCVSGMFLVFIFASAPFEEDPSMVDDYPDDFDDFSSTPFQEKLWDLQSSAAFDWAGLMPVLALLIVAALTVSAIMYVLPPTNRWYNPARAVARGRPYPVPVYYPVYYPYPGPPPVAPPVAPPPAAQPPVEPPPAEPPTS